MIHWTIFQSYIYQSNSISHFWVKVDKTVKETKSIFRETLTRFMLISKFLHIWFSWVLSQSPQNISYLRNMNLSVSSAVKELKSFLKFCKRVMYYNQKIIELIMLIIKPKFLDIIFFYFTFHCRKNLFICLIAIHSTKTILTTKR